MNDFNVGDQVVMAYNYCSTCDSCRTGYPSSCDDFNELNLSGKREDGTYTFYKEDETPVYNFLHQSSFSTYTIADEIEGCSTIIAVDIHDSRLELARELGATHTINSKTDNLTERIDEITNGQGVNYSIDTTGVYQVMKASINVLAKGGKSAPLAVSPNSLEFNPYMDLVMERRQIVGVIMGDVVPQIAVRELVKHYKEGNFPFEKMLKFYKFRDINQAAKDSTSGESIKPILIIDEEYRKHEPIDYVR